MVMAMPSINVGAILGAVTVAGAAGYLVPAAVDALGNRKFGLWDAIGIMQMRAVAPGIATAAIAAEAIRDIDLRQEGHHTIPIYLCGDETKQETSLILHLQHRQIHREIAAVVLAKELGESFANQALGRRRSLYVLDLAQTEPGRQVIVNLLDQVYANGQWKDIGDPQIGVLFAMESPLYVSGVRTSLKSPAGVCKRKR